MEGRKINKKLEKIRRENADFEKNTPYNFCDRWCMRCSQEKKSKCHLYLDDFSRKMPRIVYGKADDFQITAELLKWQFRNLDEPVDRVCLEETGADFDEFDDFDGAQEDFDEEETPISADNHSLQVTVEQYRKKAGVFMKNIFSQNPDLIAKLNYDFETIAWYHTLLAAKMHRALYGLNEPGETDETGVYDAVAQFAICAKAINKSIEALRKLKENLPSYRNAITELLALLNNISSRMLYLEESI